MNIISLNEAMEILQGDTPLAIAMSHSGEDISLDAVYAASEGLYEETDFTQYLKSILTDIGIPLEKIAEDAHIDKVLCYQVLVGITRPTFNTLIRLCYGAYFSIEETQKAIALSGYKPLNKDDPRDSILISGLIFHKSISEINNEMYYLDPSKNLFLL
ncbi:MAG: hypothetical protein IKN54_08870 [Lachnospiraceae bacterium]|nr:hypothetical protein [Lachnospiraceae bacterium]